MSFVKREINRFQTELTNPSSTHHNELYAAQQALERALEPSGIKSPFEMIKDTQEGSEDCLAHPHPAQSLDICCQTG